jgi:hypothetical protein
LLVDGQDGEGDDALYRFKTRRTVPTWYFMRSATLPGGSTR